jgi:hypothetical protein
MNCEDQQVGIPSHSVKWGAPTLGTQKRHSQLGVKVPVLWPGCLWGIIGPCWSSGPICGQVLFLFYFGTSMVIMVAREVRQFLNSACDVSWLFRIFQVLHLFPFIPTVRCVRQWTEPPIYVTRVVETTHPESPRDMDGNSWWGCGEAWVLVKEFQYDSWRLILQS